MFFIVIFLLCLTLPWITALVRFFIFFVHVWYQLTIIPVGQIIKQRSPTMEQWRGHSSVVEHSTADREVTGSIPVAPFNSSLFFKRMICVHDPFCPTICIRLQIERSPVQSRLPPLVHICFLREWCVSMILFVQQKHFFPFFNKCISELTTTAKFYRTPGTYIFAVLNDHIDSRKVRISNVS